MFIYLNPLFFLDIVVQLILQNLMSHCAEHNIHASRCTHTPESYKSYCPQTNVCCFFNFFFQPDCDTSWSKVDKVPSLWKQLHVKNGFDRVQTCKPATIQKDIMPSSHQTMLVQYVCLKKPISLHVIEINQYRIHIEVY